MLLSSRRGLYFCLFVANFNDDNSNLQVNSLNGLVLLTDYWLYFSFSKVKCEPIYLEHWNPLHLQVHYINRKCIFILFGSDFIEVFSHA